MPPLSPLPPSFQQSNTSVASRLRVVVLIVLAIVVVVFCWRYARRAEISHVDAVASHAGKETGRGALDDSADVVGGEGNRAATDGQNFSSRPGVSSSRADQEGTVVTPSGVRKVLVDAIARLPEVPGWPEGPQLFAEVETATKRYVNLRPNPASMLPTLTVQADEMLMVRIHLPEGGAGEKVFLELPDGGRFAATEAKGQVLTLDKNRMASFVMYADGRRGNCSLAIRQQGHNRVLPLWVGQLLDVAEPLE